jgi:hypothetical protein
MNKHISALFALMMGALMMTSCLKSDDSSSSIIYNNDTAITAFSLTTVNRYIHTTSKSGKDTINKKAISNPVTFYIDHYNKRIYNADSLPADCDLKHVVTSISTKNSGAIAIKSLISDTLFIYNATDSIDFTQTREIRIYAQDRSTYRAYQVTVNKHQAATGKLLWEEMPAGSYPVDEVKEEWEQIVANAGLDRFIGAGTTEAYAFDKEGHLMVTTDQGATWEIDDLDDDLSLLPHESVAFVSYPFEANEQTDYQMIVGESGEIGNESSVWRKIVEYGDNSQPGKWVYMPYESYNKYYLPNLPDMSLVWFHKTVMAIGSTYILITRDGGITWKESATMQLPAGDLMDVEARTDDKGALWLKEKNSDKVWRGILVEE